MQIHNFTLFFKLCQLLPGGFAKRVKGIPGLPAHMTASLLHQMEMCLLSSQVSQPLPWKQGS